MSSSRQTSASVGELRAYHERSKHRFESYADGPGQLDWDAQPAPFRHFDGAPSFPLELAGAWLDRPFAELAKPYAAPAVADARSVGALLELSFGLSAWKSWGPSRWALRCNPSSGNLHPAEAYLLANAIPGLPDGVLHYDPLAHALELRAAASPAGRRPWLLIGLSSIMWREAWKYGERAFRYCQLDTGHALGALSYAAALPGWPLRPLPAARLAGWLGLERGGDFPGGRYGFTEREEAEALLAVAAPGLSVPAPGEIDDWLAAAAWHGRASCIDPAPGYRWPLVDEAAAASREAEPAAAAPSSPPAFPPLPGLPPLPLLPPSGGSISLIRRRRSAQRFNPRHRLPKAAFYRLLDALLPRPQVPWNVMAGEPLIHLVLFVLRVDGLEPGLYLLPRSASGAAALAGALQPADGRFAGRRPLAEIDPDCPPHLELARLCTLGLQEAQRLARSLSCHQDIAATGAFSLVMLGELDSALAAGGHGYRLLLREAGLVGQAIYLEAEAAGVRGTGIGCFFDDPVHRLLGLADTRFQSIYHFTLGDPVDDPRIESAPPYSDRTESAP